MNDLELKELQWGMDKGRQDNKQESGARRGKQDNLWARQSSQRPSSWIQLVQLAQLQRGALSRHFCWAAMEKIPESRNHRADRSLDPPRARLRNEHISRIAPRNLIALSQSGAVQSFAFQPVQLVSVVESSGGAF